MSPPTFWHLFLYKLFIFTDKRGKFTHKIISLSDFINYTRFDKFAPPPTFVFKVTPLASGCISHFLDSSLVAS